MMNSYKSFDFERKWMEFMHKKVKTVDIAKNLFVTWTSKIEYMRFKKLLRKIGILQVNYRKTKMKRTLRLNKYIGKIVGRQYKFYSVRQKLIKANKLSQTLQNVKRQILMRRFFIRMRWAKQNVNWIFDSAWKNIEIRSRKASTLTLQRTLRGY